MSELLDSLSAVEDSVPQRSHSPASERERQRLANLHMGASYTVNIEDEAAEGLFRVLAEQGATRATEISRSLMKLLPKDKADAISTYKGGRVKGGSVGGIGTFLADYDDHFEQVEGGGWRARGASKWPPLDEEDHSAVSAEIVHNAQVDNTNLSWPLVLASVTGFVRDFDSLLEGKEAPPAADERLILEFTKAIKADANLHTETVDVPRVAGLLVALQRRFLASREVDEIEPAVPQFDREGYKLLFLMARLHGKAHLLFSREHNLQGKDAEEPCLSSALEGIAERHYREATSAVVAAERSRQQAPQRIKAHGAASGKAVADAASVSASTQSGTVAEQALAALDLPLQKVAQAAGQIGWQAENLQRDLFAAGLCNNVFGKELLVVVIARKS